MTQFGDLFVSIRNGKNVRQGDALGGLPITRIETISSGSIDVARVGYAGLDDSTENWLLRPADILFSHINSPKYVGRVAMYEGHPQQLIHGMNLLCLRPDQSVVDPRYALHMIRSQGFRSLISPFINKAVNQASISITNLRSIEVTIPPLPEQRRIAAILDHADALRAKRRQVLSHLDTLTNSIFHDMFGDAAWASTLGELADVQIGPFGSLLHKDDYVSGGVPVLNPMHIRGGQIRPDYEFAVTEEKAASLPQYRIRAGDILLGRRGEMGRAGVAMPAHDGMLCGTGSLILRPRRGDSSYLHAVATSPRMKSHLERNSLGATLPNLNTGIVKSSPAPAAAIERQREFAGRIAQVHSERASVLASQAASDELFTSLQSRAFRGGL